MFNQIQMHVSNDVNHITTFSQRILQLRLAHTVGCYALRVHVHGFEPRRSKSFQMMEESELAEMLQKDELMGLDNEPSCMGMKVPIWSEARMQKRNR